MSRSHSGASRTQMLRRGGIALCAALATTVASTTPSFHDLPVASAQMTNEYLLEAVGNFETIKLQQQGLRSEVSFFNPQIMSNTFPLFSYPEFKFSDRGGAVTFEPTEEDELTQGENSLTLKRVMKRAGEFTATQIFEITPADNNGSMNLKLRYELDDHTTLDRRPIIVYRGRPGGDAEVRAEKTDKLELTLTRTAEEGKGNYATMSFSDRDIARAVDTTYGKVVGDLNSPEAARPLSEGIWMSGAQDQAVVATKNEHLAMWLANPASRSVTAEVNYTFHSNMKSFDSDGDGLSDAVERQLAAEYGTDPDKQDVFLQLNWMPSERSEHPECVDTAERQLTAQDVATYMECLKYSDRTFAPSADSLEQSVAMFARGGINLHIDAGDVFTNVGGKDYTPQGGELGTYKEYFFGDNTRTMGDRAYASHVKSVFKDLYETTVQGERRGLFHLGYIGDRRDPRFAESTGVAHSTMPVFFISKNIRMQNKDHVRNTIMHEFGHTLGLEHGGPRKVGNRPGHDFEVNYKTGHKSIMNYLYQLKGYLFDFQQEADLGSYVDQTSHEQCSADVSAKGGNVKDECGELGKLYLTDAEWGNMQLGTGFAATVFGGDTTPTPEPEDPETEEGDDSSHFITPDVTQLEDLDKKAYGGTGTLNIEPENYLRAFANDNAIKATVRNAGEESHTFTVQYTYLGKTYTREVTVPGAPRGEVQETTIGLPMPGLDTYQGRSLDVTFTLFNSDGRVQNTETQSLEFLDYSREEAAELRTIVANDPNVADELRAQLDKALDPTQNPSPAPAHAADGTGDTTPKDLNPQTEGESFTDSVAFKVIIGILAVVGILAPIAAVVASMGSGGKPLF